MPGPRQCRHSMRVEIGTASSLLHKLHYGGKKAYIFRIYSMSEYIYIDLPRRNRAITGNIWGTYKTLLASRTPFSRLLSEPSTNEITLLSSRTFQFRRGYLLKYSMRSEIKVKVSFCEMKRLIYNNN